MDSTLREYLKQADEIHQSVDKTGFLIPNEELEAKVHELQVSIKTIQSVSKRLADISNIVNTFINKKKSILQNRTKRPAGIDPYPTGNDHAVLRALYPEESREVVPGIQIAVKVIKELSEIPVGTIYWVESLKQYAVNIAGVNIKGNLANIVSYQTENSARCEYQVECKSLKKNKSCGYYHDPEDYIGLGLNISDRLRNYTAGSWIYSPDRRPKTYYTRHIGSADCLLHDLEMLKTIQYREEIANREGQLIHDLLIYMILHNKGLLERYPHWLKKN